MRTFFRLLLFFISFNVEVRVKAEEIKFIEHPQGCIEKSGECLFSNQHPGAHWAMGEASIVFKKNSKIYRDAYGHIHFLSGAMYVDASKSSLMPVINVEFAKLELAPGRYYIARTPEKRLAVVSIVGKAKVQSQGKTVETYALTGGFQNWYAPLNDQGAMPTGVARPIQVNEFANLLYQSFGLELLQRELAHVRQASSRAISEASWLYERAVSSALSEEYQSQKRAEQQRKKQAYEDDKLRQMFRRKYNNTDFLM